MTTRSRSSERSLPSLAEAAARKLNQLQSQRVNRTIQVAKPYSPHPPGSKQLAFLALDCEEAGYGGAAGGGKSDALIMAALQYVDVPGYSAGIFRRTKEDLNKPDSILHRAHAWFSGTAARWDEKLHGYCFPTLPGKADATIHFGYGTTKREIEDRYQGTSFQYIGVDEGGQWILDAYRYLFSRVRKPEGMPVPLRARVGFNPGGRGAEWIKDRFVRNGRTADGLNHAEYRAHRKAGAEPTPPYLVSPPSPEAVDAAQRLGRQPRSVYFVPAFVDDNPGLDVGAYRAQLAELDPVTRAQLEEGDFDAVDSGEFFKPEWFKFVEVVPAGARQKVRYWDLAATEPKPGTDPDWTAGVLMSVERTEDKRHRYYIEDVVHFRAGPAAVESRVKATALVDGKTVPIWIEEEPGSAGKNNTDNYAARVVPGYVFKGHRKTGSKPEFWKPLASAAQNGLLFLKRAPWNREFIAELCALPFGKKDQADSAGGAFSKLTQGAPTYEDIPELKTERRY